MVSLAFSAWIPTMAGVSMEPLIKGLIFLDDSHYRLQPEGSNEKLYIIAHDPLVRSRLYCLKHGDFMSGNAISMNESQVVISSLDYVGLRELIGVWRNETEVYRFTDFRNFEYWNFNQGTKNFSGPFSYHYALSPYGQTSQRCLWKIFIIDNQRVTLGSLEWSASDQIHLQIQDPDTGEVTSSKRLIRSVF